MFTVLSVRVVVRWIRKRCDEKSSVVEVTGNVGALSHQKCPVDI